MKEKTEQSIVLFAAAILFAAIVAFATLQYVELRELDKTVVITNQFNN